MTVTWPSSRQTRAPYPRSYPNPFTPAALGILWQEYSAGTRSATVRLGEGVLYGGLRGAHVLGLVPLYGLEYDPADGVEIGFRWRDTMTELMREALYLRRVTFRMVSSCSSVRGSPLSRA